MAQFMVILDLTIVNVALPSMQANLGFTAINLQWVVIAYALVFAGFLMLGGRAADQIGQRKTLVFALLLFALTSAIGGVAVSQLMLVAARAVQGLSGALMAAGSLAAITSSFAPGPARHRAVGLWGAMNGAGGAAGAFFGGIITQELGWRWVLLINPPIGIAAAIIGWKVIVDRPTKVGAKFDLAGALTLTGGLILTAYGIVNASSYGVTTFKALVPFIAGVVLNLLFPLVEKRAADPLVPLQAITRPLRSANIVVLLFSTALFPMWYLSSLYLQQVIGLSPLDAGLAFFPMALTIMIMASQAGRLVSKFGVRAVLASGLCMLTTGLLLLVRITPNGNAAEAVVLPGILVAAGIGLSIVPSTIAATQFVDHKQAGLAAGLVNTSRQIGGSLGLALLASIATWYSSRLIGGTAAVTDALTKGFRLGYLIAAGFALAALVCTFWLLPAGAPGTPAKVRRRLPAGVLTALVVFAALDFAFAQHPAAPIGAYTTDNTYSFVSAPGLRPPMIKASTPTDKAALASGYILLTDFYDVTRPPMTGQGGPLILDNNLQPVWFRPVSKDVVAADLSYQTYDGKPALSWWQGNITATGATLSGEYIVVNDHYQVVATLKGADGWVPTVHTMVITGHTAWVTANKNMPMNLASYGGSVDGAITDSAVQEYDLRTGKLLQSWDALKHIPMTDTHAIPPTNGFPWDLYHVNAIQVVGPHTLLVSMRDTWAAYLIDTTTGKIQWQLGGKHSSFTFGPNTSFQWQHDVTMADDSTVTLFDDNCCQISGAGTYLAPNGPSRALTLRLNLADHTVSLGGQYQHPGGQSAAYMGSAQALANGNMFVGWGNQPYFSEFSKSGKLLLDATLPGSNVSYRVNQLSQWNGLPLTPPSAAATSAGGKTVVYASWNGATGVRSWRVLGGPDSGHLSTLTTVAKSGFETAIPVGSGSVFKVQALDAQGNVIGTSAVFRSQA